RPSLEPGPSSTPGLHCLADGDPNERPPYSNFTLIKYAILGSTKQKLTLSEIYFAIANRFPWFDTAGKGWKNSVRHCLSLDTQFQKEPRPPSEPGKGCYWTVSLDTPRGTKRERKR
ncbi:winged helix DNA-binding domain-containing protein, partial [Ramaria rubella]